MLIALAFLWLRPVPVAGPAMRDFESYYAAGATWRGEHNPYGRDIWQIERRVPGVVATRDELLPFVGPPFTLPLYAFFATVPFQQAALLWAIALALCTALFGFCIARLAALRDVVGVAAFLVLGAAFGPLTSALALGQAALPACAGVVATTLALRRTGTRAAAASAATLLALVQPNIAAPLAARLTDRRAVLAIVIAVVAAVGIGIASLGGMDGTLSYGALLARHAAAERTIAIQVTTAGVAYGLGASDVAARLLAVLIGVAVVAVTAWRFLSARYEPLDRVAIACAALPLVLPFAHEHDLTIVLFPAIVCLRRARASWWVVAACATILVAVDWLGLAQRPTGVAQSVALALAAACAVVAVSNVHAADRTMRVLPSRVAPFIVALAVALVGSVAAAHPLAVWPAALSHTFHAPPGADATEVWRLEQVRSGLEARSIVAAMLRALSLLGCALLWTTSLAVLPSPESGVRYRRS